MEPNQADPTPETPTNRPLAVVTFSVVTMFIGAGVLGLVALVLLVGLCVAPAGTFAPLGPAAVRFAALLTLYYAAVVVCLARGLRKNRYWAWDATACIFAVCGVGGLGVATSGIGGRWVAGLIGAAVVSVTGLIWRQFAHPITRETFSFTARDGRPVPSAGLRLVAAYHLLMAGLQFAEALNPLPARIFGMLPRGVPLMIYAVVTGTASLYVGFGLYAMRRSAYRIGVAYALWRIAILIFWMVAQAGDHSSPAMFRVAMGVAAGVLEGFILWQLLVQRSEYS